MVEVLPEYLEEYRLSHSKESFKLMQQTLNEFYAWNRMNLIDRIRRVDLLKYRQWLIDNKKTPRTAANKMLRVNQFLRHALGLPEGKGLVTVKDDKFVEFEPTVFNHDELAAFFKECNPFQFAVFKCYLMAGLRKQELENLPRYNIAPTQPVPVIRQHPKEAIRQISTMRWGLVPHWAKDASGAASTINARSETAATRPAFRDPLKSRRCLIPADGFYEWKRNGTSKQPYCFEVNDGELFAFAGLWDGWKNADGQWIKTCSILTTIPNAVTSAIHDRMPVILSPDDYDVWLDPGMTNVQVATELLKPFDAWLMRCYPVSTRINHVGNDDEESSRPVELAETQHHRLFG